MIFKRNWLFLTCFLGFSMPISCLATGRTGEDIFKSHCAACHAPGLEHSGTFQLTATRGRELAILLERKDLTADYVKYIVRHGLNAMPAITPTIVTTNELDRLAHFLVSEKND